MPACHGFPSNLIRAFSDNATPWCYHYAADLVSRLYFSWSLFPAAVRCQRNAEHDGRRLLDRVYVDVHQGSPLHSQQQRRTDAAVNDLPTKRLVESHSDVMPALVPVQPVFRFVSCECVEPLTRECDAMWHLRIVVCAAWGWMTIFYRYSPLIMTMTLLFLSQ